MIASSMSKGDLVFLGLAIFAVSYWIVAVGCVVRFCRRRATPGRRLPSVTILKPLRGDDGHLYDNLRSFCEQDYPNYEVIFGVRDPGDPAVSVARRLVRKGPNLQVRLIVDPRTTGRNPKVANLINLARHARHEILVVA